MGAFFLLAEVMVSMETLPAPASSVMLSPFVTVAEVKLLLSNSFALSAMAVSTFAETRRSCPGAFGAAPATVSEVGSLSSSEPQAEGSDPISKTISQPLVSCSCVKNILLKLSPFSVAD